VRRGSSSGGLGLRGRFGGSASVGPEPRHHSSQCVALSGDAPLVWTGRRIYRALVAGWDPAFEMLSVAAHQAAGMVAEQAHCDIREAFSRLFVMANATDRSLDATAFAIIGHVIQFDQ